MSPKRNRPLAAEPANPLEAAPSPGDGGRHERFERGIQGLRVGRVASKFNERILLVLGGVLAPLGLVGVLIGWYGAAHTPYLFEQVPYLISGGLLGLALVFLGSFMYFTHWLTELVKEHRAQSAAILAALERLQDEVATARSTNGATPRQRSARTN